MKQDERIVAAEQMPHRERQAVLRLHSDAIRHHN